MQISWFPIMHQQNIINNQVGNTVKGQNQQLKVVCNASIGCLILQLRYFHQNSTVIQIWFVMQGHLLNTFNQYAFNHTAHIFISLLQRQEIQQLLLAVSPHPQYSQLAHLLRANLFVSNLHQIDRTLYFLHYQQISQNQLIVQRCNLVAANCQSELLKEILMQRGSLEVMGKDKFGAQYQMIEQAILRPDLAMAPLVRQTMAPHCQTVYQVVLACQKLKQLQQNKQQHYLVCNEEVSQYFCCVLQQHARMVSMYLSSIANPLQHFAEITYRFMVYRNTVMALQNISPFAKLSKTMQIWKNALSIHYQMSNKMFVEVGIFGEQATFKEVGRITKQMLVDEGYLNDYCEGLIDLSIDQDIVAFCGHSRQQFGLFYSHLEDIVICSLSNWNKQLPSPILQQKIQAWRTIGLKPTTLRKITQYFNMDLASQRKGSYQQCDNFIETCARINGLIEAPRTPIICS